MLLFSTVCKGNLQVVVGVFYHRVVILRGSRLGVDGCVERHKDLYWFGLTGGVIPYIQFVLLLYLSLVCSRGLQTVERGTSVLSL